MKPIMYHVAADTSQNECERCRLKYFPRIVMSDDTGATLSICVGCLADAIDLVTGWKVRRIVDRYAEVSPDFQRRNDKRNKVVRRTQTHKE